MVSSTVANRVLVRISMSSLLSAGRPTIAAVALALRSGSRCLALASLGISLLSMLLLNRSRKSARSCSFPIAGGGGMALMASLFFRSA